MAILISSRRMENIGKFVTVDSAFGFFKKDEWFVYYGAMNRAYESGFLWICSTQHEFLIGTVVMPISSKTALIFDHCLTPIRLDELDESTDETIIKETELTK